MLKDGLSRKKIVKVVDPAAAYTATQNGSANGLDLAGFQESLVNFQLGAIGDALDDTNNYINLKLQHSDTVNADFVDVPVAEMLIKGDNDIVNPAVAGVAYKVEDQANDERVFPVSYIGAKRYLRPVLEFVGTHSTGTFAAVSVELSSPLGAAVKEADINP